MFCTNCGQQVADGSSFCTNCGASLGAEKAATGAAGTPGATPATAAKATPGGPAPSAPAGLAPATGEPAPWSPQGAADNTKKGYGWGVTVTPPSPAAQQDQPADDGFRTIPDDVTTAGYADVTTPYAAPASAYGAPSAAPSAAPAYADPSSTASYSATAFEEPAQKRGNGLAVAAVIMVVLALLAVVALVIVVIDPFGLNLTGDSAAPQTSQQATDPEEPTADRESEKDPLEETDPADPEASDPEEDPEAAEDPEAEVVEPEVVEPEAAEPSAPSTSEPSASAGTYMLPDSDTRLYSTSELSGMSDWELFIARNEIYARRGREFVREDLQAYFNAQPWYTPIYSPSEFDAQASSIFNSIEQQNIDTIHSLEQSRGSEYA